MSYTNTFIIDHAIYISFRFWIRCFILKISYFVTMSVVYQTACVSLSVYAHTRMHKMLLSMSTRPRHSSQAIIITHRVASRILNRVHRVAAEINNTLRFGKLLSISKTARR